MAPIQGNIHVENAKYHGHITREAQGDGDGSAGGGDASPLQAQGDSASSAATTSPTVYLGIGVGVGAAILLAVLVVLVKLLKKRLEYRRTLEVMEVEQAVQLAHMHEVGEIPRPVGVARCGTLAPLHARAGWGALSSNETIHESEPAAQAKSRKRSSISLPKRFKRRGIPLKSLKRLTAIMESPRSRNAKSPSLPFQEIAQTQAGAEIDALPQSNTKVYTLRMVEGEDVFVRPGSPGMEVLPSFAIGCPGRYGAGIAVSNDNPKALRARSVGALMVPVPDEITSGPISCLNRPQMHGRSISLGAPPSRPPSGPVPPLPVIAPHGANLNDMARRGLCISRTSSSSHGSTSSSVLVKSPILKVPEQNKPLRSPNVEEVVAEDDSASLKTVAKKQWQNPLITGPRPRAAPSTTRDADGLISQVSIRSDIARYSVESQASHRLSSVSTASSERNHNRLSIPQIGTADRVSISRASSNHSFHSISGVQKITTPRKPARKTSVSAFGSPAERKKTSILRDISGNSLPSRQPSNATQDSSRSSNGNPFQWDQPLPKPSALKGSPNARKGHRRQNCVRISTLTPQILGPPPSRPTSPDIMYGIEEESGEGEGNTDPSGLRFVSNQRQSRPSSASSFVQNLRTQTLRASLTPSSPTLSAWTAYQQHGLPSQHSDSQLSASTITRSISRQSDRSSHFSIPSFPSPIKPTLSDVQLNQPVPEFCLSRPSTDVEEENSSSPFGLQVSSDNEIPSSPPLPVSKQVPYDPAHPAWPIVDIPAPQRVYDPASPAWDETEPERSSQLFPFAANSFSVRNDEEVSPRSRPTSYGSDLPDTPPCSPKTMPEGFKAFFDKQNSGSKPARAAEKLTSANASSIMARIPSKVDFPGAPILPPPEENEYYSQTATISTKQRSVSIAPHLQPMRPVSPPPMPSSEGCMPAPLHINNKTSSQGPRTQPAYSVLKNAMALRRMNSEISNISNRESRRYVRLGREASPLLPWIGSPDPSESCGDMNELFDFGFATTGDTAAGAAHEHMSALDEIDMTEVERRLDGTLAGFDALLRDNDAMMEQKRSSSVWEDGERYWEQQQQQRAPQLAFVPSSPVPIVDMTPRKRPTDDVFLATPRSIQATPKSLYDSDGFLRS